MCFLRCFSFQVVIGRLLRTSFFFDRAVSYAPRPSRCLFPPFPPPGMIGMIATLARLFVSVCVYGSSYCSLSSFVFQRCGGPLFFFREPTVLCSALFFPPKRIRTRGFIDEGLPASESIDQLLELMLRFRFLFHCSQSQLHF